jgi:competence protein ComFB
MKPRNLMEDIVIEKVNEIFDEENISRREGLCRCYQCRMDVACYVLNRISPMYMTSSRGLAHLRTEYQNNLQKAADLVSLIKDGIQQVFETQRPHYDSSCEPASELGEGPVYNFPTIMGRILNGNTFEPMTGIKVDLLSKGNPVTMLDKSWQNPYLLIEQTAGTYLFWPYPVSAESLKESRVFEFEIYIDEKGYDELHHFFEMELTPEEKVNDVLHMEKTYKVEDIYLFPVLSS